MHYIKTTIFILVLIFINMFYINAKAKVEENNLFDIEQDGYWQPGDTKTTEFEIENMWEEKCVLESITFTKSYIKDIKTGKEYTTKEAIEDELLNSYNIIIFLDDEKYGTYQLFEGDFEKLCNSKIKFNNKIYMDIDSKVKININITLNKDTNNNYQNKSYKFILEPNAYKINYETDKTDKPNQIEDDYVNSDNIFRRFIKTGDETSTYIISEIFILSLWFLVICIRRKDGNINCYNIKNYRKKTNNNN